jgi:hypothetical protein
VAPTFAVDALVISIAMISLSSVGNLWDFRKYQQTCTHCIQLSLSGGRLCHEMFLSLLTLQMEARS